MPTLRSKVINNKFKTVFVDLKDSSSGRFVQITAQCNQERQRVTVDAADLNVFITTLIEFAKEAGIAAPLEFKEADMHRIKRQHPRAYLPWTDKEVQLLAQEIAEGKTLDEIAAFHQRQPSAIQSRMRVLQPA